MADNPKKTAVLQLLKECKEPVSLTQLLELSGGIYKERTLRRWLNELVEQKLVEKLGHKRGTRYKAHENQKITGFGFTSQHVLEKVRLPLYQRQPVPYNFKWFDSYQPNESFYFSNDAKKQLFDAGKRSTNHDPAGTYAHQIYNRLLIDLSYNSSRLEGNTYTLLDTERLLLKGAGAEGKLDEETVMILNHKEAIRYLVDNASKIDCSLTTICTLHFLLSDGLVEAKYGGKIRDHSVRIGGSAYMPIEDPKILERQLKLILEKATQIREPFEQSIFLLIHISYLQAFTDVNKRTARLSANIPFVIGNLVPLSFNDVGRDDYMSAMIAIYELQEVRPLCDLFVYSYLRTCLSYDSTLKSMGIDEVRVRYRAERRAIIRTIIEKEWTGQQIEIFVNKESKRLPQHVQEAFIEDIVEDLNQLDASRIVGLGISLDQLESWLKKFKKSVLSFPSHR